MGGRAIAALPASAGTDRPQLKTLPASTLEVLVRWDRQVTALATDETLI
jgi:hypothetical protein